MEMSWRLVGGVYRIAVGIGRGIAVNQNEHRTMVVGA